MFENVFRKIQDAKPLASWDPSPGLGRHRVVLTGYRVKVSQKDQSQYPEAGFLVISTDSAQEKCNEPRSIAWFINAAGHKGTYAAGRAQAFVGAVAQCFGDTREPWQIGEALATTDQYVGTVLDLIATPAIKNGQQLRRDDGSLVLNYAWQAIPGQNAQTLAEMRGYIAQYVAAPVKPVQAPVTTPAAPAPVQMPVAPPTQTYAPPATAPVQQTQQQQPTTAPSNMPSFLAPFTQGR